MPKLGLTMEAGTIIDWLVAPGAEVGEGTAVLNIETDKVESEVEASAAGRLHIVGEKGDTYACGELIGWFLEPGETPPEAPTPLAASPASTAVAARGADVVTERSPPQLDGRILASPNARRVAAERGVDHSVRAGRGGVRAVRERGGVPGDARGCGVDQLICASARFVKIKDARDDCINRRSFLPPRCAGIERRAFEPRVRGGRLPSERIPHGTAVSYQSRRAFTRPPRRTPREAARNRWRGRRE